MTKQSLLGKDFGNKRKIRVVLKQRNKKNDRSSSDTWKATFSSMLKMGQTPIRMVRSN